MDNTNKILIVDDEPVGRQLLEAILFPEGYDILFAEDGLKAWNITLENIPDLVLLDVMMPYMDGFEVLKKIRENNITAHIPVFLITALDDRDSRIRGIDAGADDYISKPFDRVEILAKIKNSTNLVKYRQVSKNSQQEIPTAKETSLDENIFTSLIDSILIKEAKSEKINCQLFSSNPVSNSQSAFQVINKGVGTYYCLFSNNLIKQNAPSTNCILSALFKEELEDNKISISELIRKTLNKLKAIALKNKAVTLQNATISMLVIYYEPENNRIIASGLNQAFYMLGGASSINQNTENNAFQPYYLIGNQDLILDNCKNIFFFSTNINSGISQQELISFLNSHFISGSEKDLSSIIPHKFKQLEDILAVNLRF